MVLPCDADGGARMSDVTPGNILDDMSKIDPELLAVSFGSKLCPFCGKRKRERSHFCNNCSAKLPARIQRTIHRPIDRIYGIIFANAAAAAGIAQLKFPGLVGGPSVGLTRIGPGMYVDEAHDHHTDVGEMLRIFGWADTDANRQLVVEVTCAAYGRAYAGVSIEVK